MITLFLNSDDNSETVDVLRSRNLLLRKDTYDLVV